MRPMTAGTSLSEAALGRPSLLQAAVCYPSLSAGGCYHFTVRSGYQHRAPARQLTAPGTSTRHPGSTTRTASTQHRRPVSTTRTASSQHRHRRPLSLPRALPAPGTGIVSNAHSQQHQRRHRQLTAPAPAPACTGTQHQDWHPAPPSTSNLPPPRAQPAHSTGTRHPAPSTSTSNLSPPRAPAPGTSTSTSNLSPPRAQPAHSTSTNTGTRHPAPSTSSNLSRKRARATHRYLK